ncbi:MAG: serine/threonine protein kinase [Lachnospiraceae bacterium]|nr:serine/threonine protein kinase [Lachnospiraceae bacterium]
MDKTTVLNDFNTNKFTEDKSVYLPEGTVLKERYKIVEVIGVGGFGVTYKAKDNVLAAEVAIKEYYPVGVVNRIVDDVNISLFTETQRVEFSHGKIRFLKEAQDLAKFNKSSSIVSVYDFFEENNTAYMVMEYLEGCTLKDYLESKKQIDDEMMVQVTFSVMEALESIHNAGLIHRDISPDNIFICNDSKVKLIDFGAAKQDMHGENKTVSVVLKYGYAPIEQYSKKSDIGPWTDIYALGATMYKMVTGVNPEEATSRVVEDTMKEPRDLRGNMPEYINDVIMKAMAVKYTERYSCIADMRNDMLCKSEKKKNSTEPILKVDSTVKVEENIELPVAESKSQKIGKKKFIIPLLLGVLILAVVFVVILISNKDDDEKFDTTQVTTENTTEKVVDTTEENKTEQNTEEVDESAIEEVIYETDDFGDILNHNLSDENGIGINLITCELVELTDEEFATLGYVGIDSGRCLKGTFAYTRELTDAEINDWSHGGTLYEIVDGSYNELDWNTYPTSIYSDYDNFVLDFSDNLPEGIYVLELYQYIGNNSFHYEIEFEIHQIKEASTSVEIGNDDSIGTIISTELVAENGIGMELDTCELCIVDDEQTAIGWWIEASHGKAIYGKFSFNRELTSDEKSNSFHGHNLYQLVDGYYVEVSWEEFPQSEYTDLDGNFYMNFDDNMPAGTYKYEIDQYVDESSCTYEIVFELY